PRHQASVRITDQLAATSIEQEFYNPNDQRIEGTFLFPIPKGAQIKKFTMEIDGKPVEAELMSACAHQLGLNRLAVDLHGELLDLRPFGNWKQECPFDSLIVRIIELLFDRRGRQLVGDAYAGLMSG